MYGDPRCKSKARRDCSGGLIGAQRHIAVLMG
jgi:hypothetical protein